MRVLIILFITFSLACSNSKKTAKEDGTSQAKNELFSEDSISLSFERTLCFGACPAFKITVMNTGDCYYEGYKFVDMVGKYKATITKAQMEEIQNEAKLIDFFNLQDEYDAPITDIPSVIIMMPGKNGRKQVIDRAEAPESLKLFERYLDRILLNLDWQKAE